MKGFWIGVGIVAVAAIAIVAIVNSDTDDTTTEIPVREETE